MLGIKKIADFVVCAFQAATFGAKSP